jgi:transposase
MPGKLPFDAFDYYYSLGPGRSYAAVASHYGVSKRAVTSRALQERWQERILDMERQVRESVTQKTRETLEEMTERHLRVLKAIQRKALEALRSMPLDSAMEAVRALGLAIKEERSVRGEPGDRDAQSVESIIRREYERWLEPVPADESTEPSGGDDGEATPKAEESP